MARVLCDECGEIYQPWLQTEDCPHDVKLNWTWVKLLQTLITSRRKEKDITQFWSLVLSVKWM